MQILDIIKGLPFFASLSEVEHASIIENIQLHYYPSGHIIFKQGDFAETLYIIRSGKVRIFKQEDTFERTIAVLKENDFFGEMALISDNPRNATAEVLEECELFVLYKKDLYFLLQKTPSVAEVISKTFLQRSQENQSIDNL